MPNYQVATGHNQTGALADVAPQPASEGAQFPERLAVVGGGLYDDGTQYIDLIWNEALTEAEALVVLAAFGLWNGSATVNTANVTLYAPTSIPRVWKNWNGVAVLPRIGESASKESATCWYSDFVVRVKELGAI
ncbi:MAG: hypothetical protein DRI61_10650 [Chloroflexi bacterium]|nr:MAG: hypothetical protein DRI61_10650 [Chloroflexota bacterium]